MRSGLQRVKPQRMKKAARRGRNLAAKIVSPEGDAIILAGQSRIASFLGKIFLADDALVATCCQKPSYDQRSDAAASVSAVRFSDAAWGVRSICA